MENRKINQCTSEIIKNEIRKGRLVKSNDILTMLPELLEAVYIDKNKMKCAVEKSLHSNNPFNAILNLFGIQVIRKEKTIDELVNSGDESEEVSVDIDETYAKQWLALNAKKAEAIVAKISDKLYEIESEAIQNYDDERSRGNDLFTKYEKLTREYNSLKTNTETTEKMIAERIQYILSVGGEAALTENEQLIELLKDMDIEVYWSSEEAGFSNAAMFTDCKIDDASISTKIKPCLVRSGKVYIKGIRFIFEK